MSNNLLVNYDSPSVSLELIPTNGIKFIISIAWPINEVDCPILVRAQYLIQLLSVLRKHLVIGQFSFSQFFIGHYIGSTLTRMDQNGPDYWIKPDCAGRA